MTINGALFSSKSGEWATPQTFFDRLNAEFHFTLDPCATHENAKCANYYTIEDDGLAQPWPGRVYVNPPYGREIGRWVRKAYEEVKQIALVVMLIPARTDTAYWHDYVMRASEIRFVRGRLRFGDAAHSAPFPSAVVVFDPGHIGPPVLASMVAAEKEGVRNLLARISTGQVDGHRKLYQAGRAPDGRELYK